MIGTGVEVSESGQLVKWPNFPGSDQSEINASELMPGVQNDLVQDYIRDNCRVYNLDIDYI